MLSGEYIYIYWYNSLVLGHTTYLIFKDVANLSWEYHQIKIADGRIVYSSSNVMVFLRSSVTKLWWQWGNLDGLTCSILRGYLYFSAFIYIYTYHYKTIVTIVQITIYYLHVNHISTLYEIYIYIYSQIWISHSLTSHQAASSTFDVHPSNW